MMKFADRIPINYPLYLRQTLLGLFQVPDWNAFKAQFREIRRAGSALTVSEVAKGRVGLAAPISFDGQVIAGISLAGISRSTKRTDISGYISCVVSAAAQISHDLSKETSERVHQTVPCKTSARNK